MREATALSATEASALLASGELTSAALVSACLDRISVREPDIQAWAWIDAALALNEARERDSEQRRSPLHGIPIAVKDIVDTAQIPTARGSAIYADRIPSRDAACVAALRRAGAVILGKTVTTEFAASYPGPTRNPRNTGHTPGGSSSGSAAAVADQMVPLAIGSQTSGSIVRPAAFCGVFALKPTLGMWPTAGVQALAPTLDTLGVFARDPNDLSLVFPHMGGTTMPAHGGSHGGFHGDAQSDSSAELRIGFARTPHWDELDSGSAQLILELVESLRATGTLDAETSLPSSFAGLVEAQLAIFGYESARELDVEYTHHRASLSDVMRQWLEKSRALPTEEYHRALEARMTAGLDMDAVWDRCDVLLTPAVKGEAPESLTHTGDPLFCRPWSTLGGPALALPLLTGAGGLPVGLQLTGPPGSEAALFAAARKLLAQADRPPG